MTVMSINKTNKIWENKDWEIGEGISTVENEFTASCNDKEAFEIILIIYDFKYIGISSRYQPPFKVSLNHLKDGKFKSKKL